MIEHTLHIPRNHTSKIEIRFAGDSTRCPFCNASGWLPGKVCRCGVANPSERSYTRPTPSRRKKHPAFRPKQDGLLDRDPLADQQEDDDTGPIIDHTDTSLPWN